VLDKPAHRYMFPAFYQTTLQTHLTDPQYLTLQLLLCWLQVHHQVKLSVLASVFPQPIHYNSRKQSKTELTAVFNLASIEYQAAVVSAGQILSSARANRTGIESIRTPMTQKTKPSKVWVLDFGD
jgi:hypothetical protein